MVPVEALRESYLVAVQDLRHSVRTTKALAFLIIYGLLTLCSGGIVIWSVAAANHAIDDQVTQLGLSAETVEANKADAYQKIVESLVGDKARAEYYLSIPLIILFFFWASRLFLPWLIALMTYDQIAGEIQHRSARYTLLRANRGALLGGKIGANMFLVVILTVVTNLILISIAAWKIPGFDLGASAYHLLRFWLLILPLGLAWVCLMALLSSLFRTPYLALLAGLGVILVTGLLNMLSTVWESIAPLRYAFPWHWASYLLSQETGDQLMGVAGLLGFALLFGASAYLVLKRRDL